MHINALPQKKLLPFQNLPASAWLNLAIAAVSVFYLLHFGFDIYTHNLCGNLAIDYCAYWSAAKISLNQGYSHMYDQELVSQIQKTIFPHTENTAAIQTVPYVYLPVFILPFQLLSFLGVSTGYWIWSILSLVSFILYLRFFTARLTGNQLPKRLLYILLISLPVFLNVFWGQMDIWLGIFTGEFIRAILDKKPFKAGVWLSGYLIKPQLLILIVPILLFQKSFKALAGLLVTTSFLLITSLSMAGRSGFEGLFNLLSGSAQGEAASNAVIMMNWRMLGLNLSAISSVEIGWAVILIGSILVLVAVAIISGRMNPTDSIRSTIAFLGIFAATGAVTWHAHFSMSIILIPPLAFLCMQERFPRPIFVSWVFVPIIGRLLAYILAILVRQGFILSNISIILYLLTGLWGLIFNMVFVIWSIQASNRAKIILPNPEKRLGK